MSMELKQLNPWGVARLKVVQTFSESFRGNTYHWKKRRIEPRFVADLITEQLSETELEVRITPDPDPQDTTAPTLSNASATATGSTTAEATVDTDEADGVLYWVVTTSSTAPTSQEVQDGKNANGNAAAASGAKLIGTDGTNQVAADGLSSSTTYYFHLVHVDEYGNTSSVASTGSITTS